MTVPSPTKPPAIFDVMVGQDESITGGRLRGSVLRLDSFYPLPIGSGRLVYLFGSGYLGLKRTTFRDPLLLSRGDDAISPTSKDTYVFAVPPANRDYYRIGLGFNLSEILNRNK